MELDRCKISISLSLVIVCFFVITGCGSGDGISQANNYPFGATESTTQNGSPLSLNDGLDQDSAANSKKIDCENKLPCVWLSADAGLIVTVESIGTGNAASNLEIRYSLQTTRDTKIRWLPSVLLIDESSRQYTLLSTEVGSEVLTSNNTARNLFAGARLGVNQSFRESPDHSTQLLSRYAVSFVEAELRHQVEFTNLPIDGENGEEIDCLFKRPCRWISPNEEFGVTIILADSPLTTGRLTLHYQIEAFEDITLLVETDSTAIDNLGVIYTPKTHTVDSQSDYLDFEVPVFADTVTSADLTFFRAKDTAATSLKKLSLSILQDNTEFVGSPLFINIPLD